MLNNNFPHNASHTEFRTLPVLGCAAYGQSRLISRSRYGPEPNAGRWLKISMHPIQSSRQSPTLLQTRVPEASARNPIPFFFSSRRRHTICSRDWSSDVCSSDLPANARHHIVDERVVAARRAVAEHRDRLARQHQARELVDRQVRPLARAVDGEEAQRDEAKIGRASCRERGWS